MKIRKVIDSFNYAIDGLLYGLKTQRNMKIHFAIALLVLILAGITHVSRLEAVILIIVISMVIAAEMLNTAVETVVDMIRNTYHPLAAIAKNVAAGAVLVTAVNAAVVGYLIFYDKLSMISFRIVYSLEHMPVHVTVISLIIVTLIVIISKAFGTKGSFLRGGMPSGHSALAMSLMTSITFLSGNAVVAMLSGLLALIVFHSRLEAKIHTFWEIVTGALLGLLVTMLVFRIFQIS